MCDNSNYIVAKLDLFIQLIQDFNCTCHDLHRCPVHVFTVHLDDVLDNVSEILKQAMNPPSYQVAVQNPPPPYEYEEHSNNNE